MTARVDPWTARRDAIKPAAASFPEARYRSTLTGADILRIHGFDPGWKQAVDTWLVQAGHWTVSEVIDGGKPEVHEGYYAADGGTTLQLVIPTDWKEPQTSGVYGLGWKKDADGTIHFTQIDDEAPEAYWAVPFVWLGPP